MHLRLFSLSLRLLVVLLVSVSGLGGADRIAGASQEASPAASSDMRFPITPGAVEPRAPEALLALFGTPVAAGVPAVEPLLVEVPVGQRADEETRAGVIAAMSESTACFNDGDSLRAFALATDAFLQGFVEENALTAEDIAFLAAEAEPTVAEAQSTILAVTDIAELADGRAGAFVVTSSEWRGPDTSYMIFIEQGGRWLLDEVIDFS